MGHGSLLREHRAGDCMQPSGSLIARGTRLAAMLASVASAIRLIMPPPRRILANGRFSREHTGVGPVENRVRHVGRFGAVGRSCSCMLSSICVAMITGL